MTVSRQGLIAEYLFEGNAQDSSGEGRHGQVVGATPTSDRFGRSNSAYAFDGKNDYVIVVDPPAMRAEALTISAWVRYDEGGFRGWNNAIIAQDSGDDFWRSYAEHGRILQLATRDRQILWHRMGQGGDVGANQPIVTGAWYHVAAVVDGKAHHLYLNGLLHNTRESWFASSATEPLYIGRKAPPAQRMFFRGCIDDVRIYNRALSVEEIQALHDEGGWVDTAPAEYHPRPEPLVWQGADWCSLDIGTLVPGSTAVEGESLVVHAAGTGIAGRADHFRYVYQPCAGDFTATVTLREMPVTTDWNRWARAGIMLRQSLEPDAAHVLVCGVRSEGGCAVWRQQRAETGGGAADVRGFDWRHGQETLALKLVRRGDTVAAFAAKAGGEWTPVGDPVTVAFGGREAYIGLAVTPNTFGTLDSARFEDWRWSAG